MKYFFLILTILFVLYSCDTSTYPINDKNTDDLNKISDVDSIGYLYFDAQCSEDSVFLFWDTEYEIENSGFEVQVSADSVQFDSIGFVAGQGTTYNQTSYHFSYFIDNPDEKFYRLKIISSDGQYTFSEIIKPITAIKDVNDTIPKSFELNQNYPNPYTRSTTISFSIPSAVQVKLTVFDEFYSPINILINEFKPAGTHSIQYQPQGLDAGLYYYEFKANGVKLVKAMYYISD